MAKMTTKAPSKMAAPAKSKGRAAGKTRAPKKGNLSQDQATKIIVQANRVIKRAK